MASLTQLSYILAVEKERHFGKAALACHVSQPALSAQIQKLEEELEVVIFDRSKKPILTTEAGQRLLEQAATILHEHRKFLTMAQASTLTPRGPFRLDVIPTLAPYVLPHFLAKFSKDFHAVQLKINEHKTEDIIKRLIDDESDAGLLVTPLEEEQLIERHLFFERFFVYAGEHTPFLEKEEIVETDLDPTRMWLLEEGHCFREQALKICTLSQSGTALPNVEFAGGNLETLKNLVLRSGGFTLLPELSVIELSEEERRQRVRPFAKPIPTREVSLVHSRSFWKASIIEALEHTILHCLPQGIRSLKKADLHIVRIS
jgi:LysR family hydrogen peroxide-inducible transcriptional activator